MKGNVCRRARTKNAYEIHRWNTWSRSYDTPVSSVIQFVLLAVALLSVSTSFNTP